MMSLLSASAEVALATLFPPVCTELLLAFDEKLGSDLTRKIVSTAEDPERQSKEEAMCKTLLKVQAMRSTVLCDIRTGVRHRTFHADNQGYYKGEAIKEIVEDETTGTLVTRTFPHGVGFMKHPNGSTFHGTYQYGVRDGWGTMRYTNGAVHEGQWEHGKAQGHGTLRFPDGSFYSGEFQGGVRDGYGTSVLCSGKSFMEFWREGELLSRELLSRQ